MALRYLLVVVLAAAIICTACASSDLADAMAEATAAPFKALEAYDSLATFHRRLLGPNKKTTPKIFKNQNVSKGKKAIGN